MNYSKKRKFKPQLPTQEQREKHKKKKRHMKYREMVNRLGNESKKGRLERRNKEGKVICFRNPMDNRISQAMNQHKTNNAVTSNPVINCTNQFVQKKICPTCNREYNCMTVFHDPTSSRKCKSCGHGISFRRHKCSCTL